jgi:DNA polymerase III epsilon subunit-like protein
LQQHLAGKTGNKGNFMAKDLNRLPTWGLAIDWETSGYSLPNYASKHQGISYGAIVFDVKTLEPVESLYREIHFNSKYIWDAGAEKVHGISREHLAKNGVSQEDAAFELVNLVNKYLGNDSVMILGHRVHFDKAFTNQLLDVAGLEFTYHPSTIDSCSMATILLEQTFSEDIFKTLGLPARGIHNALEDITYTLAAVKKMKEYFLAGVASSF